MTALWAFVALAGPSQVPSKDNSDVLKRLDPYVRAHIRAIPDGKNGWIAITGLPLHGRSPTVTAGMSTEQAKAVLQQLQPQAANLDRAISISKMPLWQQPVTGDTITDFPRVAVARTYAKLLSIRGQARITVGKGAQGLSDLLAAMRIGVSMENGSASIVGWLAAEAAEAAGVIAINRCVSLPAFTPAMASAVLAAIPPTSRRDSSMQNALRADLEFTALPVLAPALRRPGEALTGFSEALAKAVAGLPVKADIEDDARQFSRGYSILLRNLEKPWSEQQSIERFVGEMRRGLPQGIDDEKRVLTAEEVRMLRESWKSLKNPAGRYLVSMNLSLSGLTAVSFKARAEREITRAIMALRVWSARHRGVYPGSLHDVVTAGIVKTDPWDRFADKPLHYDHKRLLVWSVGANGRDDGGIGQPGRASQKDLDYVWRVDGR